MNKLWDGNEDDGDLIIARLLGHGNVPRHLRKSISLARGDEALIIGPLNESGRPMRGPDELRTKEALRRNSEILLYNRLRVFDFEFPFSNHLPPGELDPISGTLKLGVSILDDRPTLVKDRLLPMLSRRSEVTYSDLNEAMSARLESRWGQALEGSNAGNRRDPGRQEEARTRARDVAREAINPLGLFVKDAEIVWSDTMAEEVLKDNKEIARRGRLQLSQMRARDLRNKRLADDISRMEHDIEREKARMENLKLMAEIYGLEI